MKQSYLYDYVIGLETKLDSVVQEGGSNFSIGQRQLLCLARAMLKKSKVLIMDEATSNIDAKTVQLVHDSIHHSFVGCTILTIAHRLGPVIEYDRVLVLDQGQIKEFDKPWLLLLNPSSLFSSLVEETGEATAAFLKEKALQKYFSTLSAPSPIA